MIHKCSRSPLDSSIEPRDFPPSDVLIYRLENGARVILRPSDTEPKLKCYYEIVVAVDHAEAFEAAQLRAEQSLSKLISGHQQSISKLLAKHT